MHYANVELSG